MHNIAQGGVDLIVLVAIGRHVKLEDICLRALTVLSNLASGTPVNEDALVLDAAAAAAAALATGVFLVCFNAPLWIGVATCALAACVAAERMVSTDSVLLAARRSSLSDSAAATIVTLVAVALASAISKAPAAVVIASSAAASAEAVVTVRVRNAWPCSETSRMPAPEIEAASVSSAIAVVWA